MAAHRLLDPGRGSCGFHEVRDWLPLTLRVESRETDSWVLRGYSGYYKDTFRPLRTGVYSISLHWAMNGTGRHLEHGTYLKLVLDQEN